MTTEQEIFEKYKPTPPKEIKIPWEIEVANQLLLKQAIDEAYEAGRLNAKQEDYQRVEELKPKLQKDIMALIEPEIKNVKAQTAQAIFSDLRKGFGGIGKSGTLDWHGDDGKILPFLDSIEKKYLKASR